MHVAPARNLGLDFDDKVMPSIANEARQWPSFCRFASCPLQVLKSVVAQYNASQLITQQ